MNHHYKNLLLNMPVRHIVNRLETSSKENLKEQIQRLHMLEIRNFFLLGSSESIHMALKAANNLKYYGEQFAWFAGTKVNNQKIFKQNIAATIMFKDETSAFDASCCNDMKVC